MQAAKQETQNMCHCQNLQPWPEWMKRSGMDQWAQLWYKAAVHSRCVAVTVLWTQTGSKVWSYLCQKERFQICIRLLSALWRLSDLHQNLNSKHLADVKGLLLKKNIVCFSRNCVRLVLSYRRLGRKEQDHRRRTRLWRRRWRAWRRSWKPPRKVRWRKLSQ